MTPTDTAFEQSLKEVVRPLRTFAYYLARGEGEDLCQETLVRALEYRHQFTPGTNLRAWIFTIARHLHASTQRRKPRHAQLDGEYAVRRTSVHDGSQEIESRAELRRALKCLATLPRERAAAVLTLACEGLRHVDVADRSGCSEGTVKSRVSRGRRELREKMEGAEQASDIDQELLVQIVRYLNGDGELVETARSTIAISSK